MGRAEVSFKGEVEGDGMYGEQLADEIAERLNEAFDGVEDVDIYTL